MNKTYFGFTLNWKGYCIQSVLTEIVIPSPAGISRKMLRPCWGIRGKTKEEPPCDSRGTAILTGAGIELFLISFLLISSKLVKHTKVLYLPWQVFPVMAVLNVENSVNPSRKNVCWQSGSLAMASSSDTFVSFPTPVKEFRGQIWDMYVCRM